MTNQEAIETIKANYPDERYTMLREALDMAMELLKAQEPKWISVKDRLPKNDNEVITAYKIDDEKAMKKRKGKLFVKTGNWTGYRWISVWDEYKSYATEEEVLYWTPLPEPPKEEL